MLHYKDTSTGLGWKIVWLEIERLMEISSTQFQTGIWGLVLGKAFTHSSFLSWRPLISGPIRFKTWQQNNAFISNK